MKKSDLVTFRLAAPGDIPFIFSTWLRGLKYGNKALKKVPNKAFFTEMHKTIEQVMMAPGTLVRVCCLKSDPETVLGYSVASEPGILHWVFVKKAWRSIGVGTDLIPGPVTVITCATDATKDFFKARGIPLQPLYAKFLENK